MTALLLLALLAQDPPVGAPLKPVQLIDERNVISVLTDTTLAPGTVCLTEGKAVSLRDDLASKNAELAVYRAEPSHWPLTLGLTGGAAVVAGLIVGAVVYGLTAPRAPK